MADTRIRRALQVLAFASVCGAGAAASGGSPAAGHGAPVAKAVPKSDAGPVLPVPVELQSPDVPLDWLSGVLHELERRNLQFRERQGGVVANSYRFGFRVDPSGKAELHRLGGSTGFVIEVETHGRVLEQRHLAQRLEQSRLIPGPHGDTLVVERFEVARWGVEQSWILSEQPAGHDAFVIPVRMLLPEGHRFVEVPAGLEVVGPDGERLLGWSAPVAIDAAGVRQDLPFRLDAQGVRIEVPRALLRQARYPLLVDPALTPYWTALGPNSGLSDKCFGTIVASGNFRTDNDGATNKYQEFLVSQVAPSRFQDGAVHYFVSAASTVPTSTYWDPLDSTQTVASKNDISRHFGAALSVGDVDEDGDDDFLVGMNSYEATTSVGNAYLYLGSATGPGAVAQTFPVGAGQDNAFASRFGVGVHIANVAVPYDATTSARIFIGAPYADGGFANAGVFYSYSWAAGAATLLGTGIPGTATDEYLGASFATGNVQSDDGSTAQPDLLVGGCPAQPDEESAAPAGTYQGLVRIFPVDSEGAKYLSTTTTVTIARPNALSKYFGFRIGVGRVVTPGTSGVFDLLASDPRYDGGKGAVHLFQGPLTGAGSNTTFDWEVLGSATTDWVGRSLAVGDTDLDGDADFLIGCSNQVNTGASPAAFALLFYGGSLASLPATPASPATAPWRVSGIAEGNLGTGVAFCRELTSGDGFPDLLLGDATYDTTGRGAARLFHGGAPDAATLFFHRSTSGDAADATESLTRGGAAFAHQIADNHALLTLQAQSLVTGADANVFTYTIPATELPGLRTNVTGSWNFSVAIKRGGGTSTASAYAKLWVFDPAVGYTAATPDFNGSTTGSGTVTLAGNATTTLRWSHLLSGAPFDGIASKRIAIDIVVTSSDALAAPNGMQWEMVDAWLTYPAGVTAVTLSDLQATPGDGEVLLDWRTGAEVENLGFNVYRSEQPDRDFAQVNDALIVGLGDDLAGGRYYFHDRTVGNGKTYHYLLEDVELSGRTTLHGPVSATPTAGLSLPTFDPAAYVNGETQDGPTTADAIEDDRSASPTALGLTQGIRITASDATGFDLVIDVPRFTRSRTTIGAQEYDLIEVPGYEASADLERPVVPTRGLLIEVPPVVSASLARLDVDTEASGGYSLPANRPLPSPPPPSELGPIPASHDGSAVWPPSALEVLGLVTVGERTFVSLRVNPVGFLADLGVLTYHPQLRARIALGAPVTTTSSAVTQAEALQAHLAVAAGVLRIDVDRDGLYRLTTEDLAAAGFDTSRDPRTLRLYNLGREVAVRVTGEADGRLDPGDALLFHGTRNRATFTGSPQTRYSDRNAYWLAWGSVSGLRMAEAAAAPRDALAPFTACVATSRHEVQRYVSTRPFAPGQDHWFTDVVVAASASSTKDFVLPVRFPAPGAAALRYRLRGASALGEGHRIEVLLDGALLGEVAFDGLGEVTGELTIPGGVSHGDHTVRLRALSALPESVLVDFLELVHPRTFSSLDRAGLGITDGRSGKFRVDNLATTDVEVHDVTDPARPVLLTGVLVESTGVVRGSDGSLATGVGFQATFDTTSAGLPAAAMRDLRVTTGAARLTPARVALHAPTSGLRSRARGADHLVITDRTLAQAAERLATYRRGRGLRAEVVYVDEIMDEFAWGNLDPEAITRFLRHAYEAWALPRLKYVCLLGDGHYDYHDHQGFGGPNLVPPLMVETAHLWTASDNRFAAVAGGDLLPDLRIGRLPVRDAAQAGRALDKLEAYEGAPYDPAWTERALFVADDTDIYSFSGACESLIALLPPEVTPARLYHSGGDPAVVRTGIRDAVNGDGALLVTYSGHGNLFQWGNEGLWRTYPTDDVAGLTNVGRPVVGLVLNCLSGGFFHPNPAFPTMGERWLEHDGGAVAFWASTGLTRPRPQEVLAQAFYEQLRGGARVLGDMVDEAKLRLAARDADYADVVDTWVLLGDPATSILAATPVLAQPNVMPPPPPSSPGVVDDDDEPPVAVPLRGRLSGCALSVGSPARWPLAPGLVLLGALLLARRRVRTAA